MFNPMDDKIRAKYFIGWIDQSTLCKPGWYDSLIELSEVVERNGEELLLFRVPKGVKALTLIETLLQESIGDKKAPQD